MISNSSFFTWRNKNNIYPSSSLGHSFLNTCYIYNIDPYKFLDLLGNNCSTQDPNTMVRYNSSILNASAPQ